MDARSLLIDRLDLLRDQLDQVAQALTPPDDPKAKWIEKEFHNAIDERREAVQTNMDALGDGALAGPYWHGLLALEKGCKRLFREALAYLHAIRSPAVDHRLGARTLADALAGELRGACGLGIQPFTALDVDASFSDYVQIIRLRFPSCDIWDLPITAHEFGHFATYHLRGKAPAREPVFSNFVQQFLRDKGLEDDGGHRTPEEQDGISNEREKWTYRLNEFFADIFATYAMGPSFAASALLLLFDPANAFDESDLKHPSYANRASAILATLQRMDQENETEGDFDRAIKVLKDLWQDLLHSAQPRGERKEVDTTETISHSVYWLLRSAVPHARYTNWKFADGQLLQVVDPKRRTCAQSCEIRDLLNSAWLLRARRKKPPLPAAISNRVLEVWQEIAPINRR